MWPQLNSKEGGEAQLRPLKALISGDDGKKGKHCWATDFNVVLVPKTEHPRVRT